MDRNKMEKLLILLLEAQPLYFSVTLLSVHWTKLFQIRANDGL